MIDPETAERIVTTTRDYWDTHVVSDEFRGIAIGKELGHRIADLVDERTTELLHTTFDSKYERGSDGRKRPRSMGDIWIKANGMYNPINVKTGESGANGQPNMVSLKKLLASLIFCEIDSYYLLFMKLVLGDPLRCKIYLVDMLDHLDHVTFDSGPGQIMLKERQFFNFIDGGQSPPQRTITEKVTRLLELLEDGERRLERNRARVLKKLREGVATYIATGTHVVDQSRLRLA